jgi:hypothetical protein
MLFASCKTADMSLRLYKQGAPTPREFGDDDEWKIVEGGVLQISRPNGTKLLFSPAVWATLDDSRGGEPRASVL